LGSHGIGPCFGDSGGPLVVNDATGQPVLAGITSRGNKDTCKSSTAEYTRVSALDAWVEPQLSGAVDAPAPAAKPAAPLVGTLKPHNTKRPWIIGSPRPDGRLTCHAGHWQNGGAIR